MTYPTFYTAEEALYFLDEVTEQMSEAHRSLIAKNGRYTVENDEAIQRIASDKTIDKALSTLNKFFEYSSKFSSLEKWGGNAVVHRLRMFFDDLRARGDADGQEIDEVFDILREAVKRDPDMAVEGGTEEWERQLYRSVSVTGIREQA